MLHLFLADAGPAPLEQFLNFGAAGLMGAMWLWERRTSQKRELQLDEAHARILADRVMLAELLDVVRRNTEAITRLARQTPPTSTPGDLP
jgi:hypothetical protein